MKYEGYENVYFVVEPHNLEKKQVVRPSSSPRRGNPIVGCIVGSALELRYERRSYWHKKWVEIDQHFDKIWDFKALQIDLSKVDEDGMRNIRGLVRQIADSLVILRARAGFSLTFTVDEKSVEWTELVN